MLQSPEAVVVSPRRTRHRAKLAVAASTTADSSSDLTLQLPTSTPESNSIPREDGIRVLPSALTASLRLKDLRKRDLQLLLKKCRLLQANPMAIPKDIHVKGLTPSIMATLVFAQEEAGTAVCISPAGLLLTCSHCIAETPSEFDQTRSHWLLFASGRVAEAVPLAWDARRDLALLKIVAAQQQPPPSSSSSTSTTPFPFITPATSPPPVGSRLICVGHPGSEDLEAARPGVETGYDVLHLSTGTFRGCAGGRDVQDNSEIGALMHTCWTYWGHSGAPLMERKTGGLVGLHSSWDDETGMRRGVALEAIRGFLEENKQHLDGN